MIEMEHGIYSLDLDLIDIVIVTFCVHKFLIAVAVHTGEVGL